MEDCIFCKIIKGEISAEKFYEDDDVIAFLDINPNIQGHALIVPKKHFPNLLKTPDSELAKMISKAKYLGAKIIKALEAQGFNLGVNTGEAAGQVIQHVHFHIIPRYPGDGLVHWQAKKTSPKELKKIAEKIKSTIAKERKSKRAK
jgi:histidine triad (HIT) family protein